MSQVTWNGGTGYEMVLEAGCDAPAGAVYDALADPSTHLEWGGSRQRRSFRLLSLDAPAPLQVGTGFTSVGSIPMTRARWEDRSEVVEARRPDVLAFVTDGVILWPMGRRTEARWEHRYEIRPDGRGSRVIYRLRRTAMARPPLRMRVPVMRRLTHRVMIPMLCRRGFDNLLKTAERRAALRHEVQAIG
jgi:hypothetical protein